MTTSVQQTVACFNQNDLPQPSVKRSLIQIHPLDLESGPISLGPSMTLGRSSECTVQIRDDSVSRKHAEIVCNGDAAQIFDLGSTNGVMVNGNAVAEATLCSGDRIQLGTLVFRFLADDDIEAQYHETVYAMMTRDGLTGVYNKRYLTETLQREVARCKRHQRPIAVIIADVDHFKSINDAYGHIAGDQVLRELASRMQKVLREDDVLARFGGEEFAIVTVESDLEEAVDVAERCRCAVQASAINTTVGAVEVTISLGLSAPSTAHLGSPEALIREADERLYEAKASGRNRVVF